MTLWLALVGIISVVAIVYSFRVGKAINARNSEYDAEINENIRRHPVMLNPVFLAYIIGFGAILVYILYLFFK